MSLPLLPQKQDLLRLFTEVDNEADALWLLQARGLACWSTDPTFRNGAIAVAAPAPGRILCSSWDGLPPSVRDTKIRRREDRSSTHLSAAMALICSAASRGIALEGSTCYLWPILDSAHSLSLLIASGIRAIVDLDLPCPARMADEMLLAAQIMAESGVQHRRLSPSVALLKEAVTLGGHVETHGIQATSPPRPQDRP